MLFGCVLAFGGVVARGVYAQPASSLALESRAQSLYQQGRERFAAGDFEQARVAFQSSLDTVDSPNTRMYLGRTLHRLGRTADAWAMLDRAARDAAARAVTEPRYAPTREAARAEADELAPLLAWLTLDVPDVPEGLSVWVNGVVLQRGGFGVTMPMLPGEVIVEARAPGYRDVRMTFALAAGERAFRTLVFEALPAPLERGLPAPELPVVLATPLVLPRPEGLPPSRTGLRFAALTTGALAGAAAGAALAFFVSALEAERELVAGRGDEALRSSGARDQNVARALGVAAGALAVGSVALGYLAWRPMGSRQRSTTWYVTPGGVGGTF
jgi:tetratricopeptide (TPR) repeat protein